MLRVPSSFRLTLAAGVTLSCAQAVARLLNDTCGWEVRSAGAGSKGQRWYAWAWLGTASPRHFLLIRHLATGELAFHYCHVPKDQPVSMGRLIRAAGLRWAAGECFKLNKDCFGLDQTQVRLYTAIARHTVLVMAALAGCAITAALLRGRTDAQAPPPGTARSAAARRPRDDPADCSGDQAPARPARHLLPAWPRRALGELAAPPPGACPLVPPAGPARRDAQMTCAAR